MLTDMLDRDIEIGDIVIYTAAGAGKNLPDLKFGEVVKLTKAGVSVIELNNDFSRKQVKDGYVRGTGEFWTGLHGTQHEHQEFVETGLRDKEPENIRFYQNRFYIIQKI